LRNPINRQRLRCALAITGQAAAPPRRVINSRRFSNLNLIALPLRARRPPDNSASALTMPPTRSSRTFCESLAACSTQARCGSIIWRGWSRLSSHTRCESLGARSTQTRCGSIIWRSCSFLGCPRADSGEPAGAFSARSPCPTLGVVRTLYTPLKALVPGRARPVNPSTARRPHSQRCLASRTGVRAPPDRRLRGARPWRARGARAVAQPPPTAFQT
jgi:hypothetical protein